MEDADDLERLVRKGIRRVRLEDDAHSRARLEDTHVRAREPRSTVLHTTVSQTVVSHAPSACPDPAQALAVDLKSAHAHAHAFALAKDIKPPPSPLVRSSLHPSKLGNVAGRSYLKLLFVLFGSGIIYFTPIAFRILLFDSDIEVGLCQYLLLLFYFAWLIKSNYLYQPSPTYIHHPNIKDCDIIILLKMEREILNSNMAVCMDWQYSYYCYPHYHRPLSTIINDIDTINQELLQVELLILKLESKSLEKEYVPILDKVVSKYGVNSSL